MRARVCGRCGSDVLEGAHYCRRCGSPVKEFELKPESWQYEEVSDRSRLLALLLCVFLGYLGAHRFYVGKTWTGLLWLVTGGLFGVGYIADIVSLSMGNFRDKEGLRLVYWSEKSGAD